LFSFPFFSARRFRQKRAIGKAAEQHCKIHKRLILNYFDEEEERKMLNQLASERRFHHEQFA
jgi:hypothetical protein